MSFRKRSTFHLASRVERPTIDDLRDLELFRELKNETLQFICQDGLIYEVDANQSLDTTRDRINYLYVILEGYVTAWRPSCFDPGEEYFLAWRGPNQIIGEMRAIGTDPNSTRFQTCDRCRLLEIPKQCLYQRGRK
jgi:CRP-like cAMP-binding protein